MVSDRMVMEHHQNDSAQSSFRSTILQECASNRQALALIYVLSISVPVLRKEARLEILLMSQMLARSTAAESGIVMADRANACSQKGIECRPPNAPLGYR